MKQILVLLLLVGGCLFAIPTLVLCVSGYDREEFLKCIEIQGQVNEPTDIMDEETLIGILAKEIPYTYEEEAIKVQAIVSRTYMARRILGIQSKGAIIGYSKEEMEALWEEKYDSIYKIYKKAVQDTAYLMIFYDNQPIEALYHGASGGRTRDAKSVYGQEIPYLKSVESSRDHVSKQVFLTKEKIFELLKNEYPDINVEVDELESQIQIIEKDEAGYIKAIQIGNITIKGEEFKNILGLPSSNFKFYVSGEEIMFDVRGIGHGVGLSQNGANELAKQGMKCEDIIRYYYKDVSIERYEVQK